MREAMIILPLADNNGASLEAVHTNLKKAIVKAFGGYTATASEGGWYSEETDTLYEEPGKAYAIACKDSVTVRNTLRTIAEDFATIAEQECLYLRLPSGEVEFVKPSGRIAAAA